MRLFLLYSRIAITVGFLLDLLLGDPYSFPHPVRLMGRWIAWLDGKLRIEDAAKGRSARGTEDPGTAEEAKSARETEDPGMAEEAKSARKPRRHRNAQIARGCLLVFLVLLPSVAFPLLILLAAYYIHPAAGVAVESVFCYQMLAARCLAVESGKVYDALKAGDPEGARRAVSMIVGRDTERLDESGVIRAAVETVAENTSDGEVAPLFYMFFFGAAGGFFYKAVNTMDSMIGYKNEKYMEFGRCAARLDDLLNFLPSRIAALLMILCAMLEERLCPSKDGRISGRRAFRIWKRDRLKHASPNAAQTESACAGALGVRLAGDAWYFGTLVKKETLGDAEREIACEDILRAQRLMYGTSLLMLLFGLMLSAAVFVLCGL